MKKVELLAPAGNIDCLKAAIEAGCDALYIAGKMYGARAFAGNFSKDELVYAINYAHLYGVKVYLTVNTIIYESEVDNFIDFIRFVHQNNIDAVIIQDIGMLDLIRKKFPNLEIHASTQMHIHNKNGALMAKKLGIKRIVIARETPIDEIKKIKNEVDIEVECFIHGALCVSYSGQCYMSALIGERSANRGTCAQCCRKKYDIYDKNKNKLNTNNYLLSTKDLCTVYNIDKIIEANVDSLKIEGRLKSKEYVYKVVSLYRKVIDTYYETGKIKVDEKDIYELKKLFNRNFTKGFILGEKNDDFINEIRPNHQGVEIGNVISKDGNNIKIKLSDNLCINDGIRILDEKEDKGFIVQSMFINNKKVKEAKKGDIVTIKYDGFIKVGSLVLKTTDKKLIDEINRKINESKRKVLIDINVFAYKNERLKIEITDKENVVTTFSKNIIDKAINNPTSKEVIKNQVEKIRDTVYKIDSLNISMDNDIFINLKDINEVRRNVINLLNEKRLYRIPFIERNYYIDLPDFKVLKRKSIYVNDKESLNKKITEFDDIYVPSKDLLINDRYILKIPRVNNENKLSDKRVLIGDLGSLINYSNFDADFSFNVVNSYAVAFLHSMGANKVTLSYELNIGRIKDIIDCYHKRYHKHPNLEVIKDGYFEAMICRYNLCKKYNKNLLYLTDQKGKEYKVLNHDNYILICDYHKNNYKAEDYYNIGINYVRTDI